MVVIPSTRRNYGAPQVDPLQRQIENAQTRLDSIGMGAIDRRNPIEKMFNLPEGQNALLDIFEVIQRPFQAGTNVASALTSREDTRNPLTAAMQGLTGKSTKTFSDVLQGAGFEDNIGTKTAGLALDMLLDPINIIPGGAVMKAGQGIRGGASKIVPEAIKDSTIRPAKRAVEDLFSVDAPLKRTLDGGQADD